MNILCIGNSFSEDACSYLHDMAAFAGKEVNTLNLFIGGCTLETHAYNIFFNKPYYRMEYNGVVNDDCRKGSIQEGLCEREWDYISIQQGSPLSGKFETYQPHLSRIISRVRDVRPNAKILIHETWAYDPLSNRYPDMYPSCDDMHARVKEAYGKAAEAINADMIIPSGDVIQALRYKKPFDSENGGISLHRDCHHLSLSYGRYAAAATWYQMLVGDIRQNGYVPSVEDIDPELLELIKQTITDICR